MKKWQLALLLGAALLFGAQSGWAASKKAPEKTGKTIAKAPAKSSKTAAKSKAAAKPTVKADAGKARLASAGKSVRKVAYTDFEPGRLALGSASAFVIDQSTGETLVDKSSSAVLPIASISKLMTAMVVLDAQQDLQEVISIGDEDVDALKGTRSRLAVGTTMTRETAMLLALMSSDNRAAHTLGRHYPGGMPAFVAAMNQKARDLGMYQTRFEEPTGLSSNNVSTARDLVKMVAAAANYLEIRHYSTTASAQLEVNGRLLVFNNTNALVKSDNWEIGVSKTGFISEAGRCLVMQAKVASRPVIIVLLDSNGKMTRVGDANRIKRWMESAGPTTDRRA